MFYGNSIIAIFRFLTSVEGNWDSTAPGRKCMDLKKFRGDDVCAERHHCLYKFRVCDGATVDHLETKHEQEVEDWDYECDCAWITVSILCSSG
jgi:hypothetical protein